MSYHLASGLVAAVLALCCAGLAAALLRLRARLASLEGDLRGPAPSAHAHPVAPSEPAAAAPGGVAASPFGVTPGSLRGVPVEDHAPLPEPIRPRPDDAVTSSPTTAEIEALFAPEELADLRARFERVCPQPSPRDTQVTYNTLLVLAVCSVRLVAVDEDEGVLTFEDHTTVVLHAPTGLAELARLVASGQPALLRALLPAAAHTELVFHAGADSATATAAGISPRT